MVNTIQIDEIFKKPILGVGAELKNTFAAGVNNNVFIKEHDYIDNNLKMLSLFDNTVKYFEKELSFLPEIIVHDLHPEYLSTKYVHELVHKYKKLNIYSVQHHFAHMVSCMTDNNITTTSIGVIFDGTGFGLDGTIWGSEFFVADRKKFCRVGYFDYINLVSGDLGIKEPYRTTLGFLYQHSFENIEKLPFWKKFVIQYKKDYVLRAKGIKFLIDNNINIVKSCGMGRIFDIVAVLCGLGLVNSYEGALPIETEQRVPKNPDGTIDTKLFYNYRIISHDNQYIVDTTTLLKCIVEDLLKNVPLEEILTKFYSTIVLTTYKIVLELHKKFDIDKVLFSGGVFQNKVLTNTLTKLLTEAKLKVYTHKNIPCNDAGISIGQIVAVNNLQ